MTTREPWKDTDLQRKAKGRENQTQSQEVGMILKSSDLDKVQMHPHVGFSSNPCPGKKGK